VPEGDKAFPLFVDYRALAPPAAPTPAPAPASPSAAPPPPDARPPWYSLVTVPTWAFGGVALAGLGLFTGFGLAGSSAEACAPSCTASQAASIRTDFVVADVSLVAGVAAAGAAVYFALTTKSEEPPARSAPAPATAWWLGVRPAAGGAAVAAGGAF
jgi:hypothetical protein